LGYIHVYQLEKQAKQFAATAFFEKEKRGLGLVNKIGNGLDQTYE